jgi:hypothetical protein
VNSEVRALQVTINVFTAFGQALINEGLVSLFPEHDDLEVIGRSSDGADILL